MPEIAIHQGVECSLDFAAAPSCMTKVGAGMLLKLPSLGKSRGQPPCCCSSINHNGDVSHERSVNYVKYASIFTGSAQHAAASPAIDTGPGTVVLLALTDDLRCFTVYTWSWSHSSRTCIYQLQGLYVRAKFCCISVFTHCLMVTSINNLLISVASHARLPKGGVLMLMPISLRGRVTVELRSGMHNYFVHRTRFLGSLEALLIHHEQAFIML